jgi:thiosulfate/3-mercaptopyruvate sulfurtransferase
VCGIPPKEFSGEEGSRARRGHIPGSHSVPVGRLIDRESNTFLPTPRLKETLGSAIGEPDERVVTYCNAGIAAAADALALTLAGHRNVALYDGSLNEWAADPDAALVTTA